jgi:hypothetical protein
MLAAILQQNKTKSLEASVIARTTMLGEGWEVTPFDLPTCVIGPVKVAQTFGADVFKNPNYDTWALLIILYRIRSNRSSQTVEGRWVSSLNLLHCFFNHHCRPNVRYRNEAEGLFGAPNSCTCKIMVAARDVKKGEELFVSYIPEDVRTRAERRRVLRPWIGTDRLCSRCVDIGDRAGIGQPPAKIVALAAELGINIEFVKHVKGLFHGTSTSF